MRDRIRDDYAWREQEGLLLSTWGPDEESNKVRVGVPNLDADKVRRLGERYGAKYLEFEEETPPIPATRLDDKWRWNGGNRINLPDRNCTSGIPVQANSSANTYQVTAARCIPADCSHAV